MGKYHAISDPLSQGILKKDVVTCPWHGWKYNVRTGKSPHKGGDSVNDFVTKVIGNRLYIDPTPFQSIYFSAISESIILYLRVHMPFPISDTTITRYFWFLLLSVTWTDLARIESIVARDQWRYDKIVLTMIMAKG